MTRIAKTKIVPYTQKQVFDLILDIESYPQFLPWCIKANIASHENNTILATLFIKYGLFEEKYTSKVTYIQYDTIIAEMVEGPFAKFNHKWAFEKVDDKYTKVSFETEVQFQSSIIDSLYKCVVHIHTKAIMEAFLKRAQLIYQIK